MKSSEILSINQLLSDRSRLAIMAFLSVQKEADFNTLLDATELTKGNLSTHVKKLEEAGYIKVVKEFIERKPRTTYYCSELGRQELRAYLEKIERVLKGVL